MMQSVQNAPAEHDTGVGFQTTPLAESKRIEEKGSSPRPIRVAQVIGATGCGGIESVIMNYYRHIDRTQVQFDLFVESTSKIVTEEEVQTLGGNIILTPSIRRHPIQYIRYMTRKFSETPYDIVHANINTLSVFPLFAAKQAGIPVRILHNHSTWGRHELVRNLLKGILRPSAKWFATDYLACSEFAARWMYGKHRVGRGQVTVCQNAVDLTRFAYSPETRTEIREKNGWQDDFIVGHIGRFMPQKNHEYLLRVFAEVLRAEPRARLVLLGEGPTMPKMRALGEKLGLGDRVSFMGTVGNPEDYYQAFDVFVFPSRYEGLGLVAIEAQATGLPCICSDKIPSEALLTPQAKVVSLDSPSDWAREILAHRSDEHRVSGQIPSSFDLSHEAEHLLQHYQALLSC